MESRLELLWDRDAAELEEIWRMHDAINPRRMGRQIRSRVQNSLPVLVRRVQEGVICQGLDPWCSLQHECALPTQLPRHKLHPAWVRLLGMVDADRTSGWTWVDFLAVGVYVMVVIGCVAMVCVHCTVWPLAPLQRDLIGCGLMVPLLAMGIAQTTFHTTPRGNDALPTTHTRVELRGLSRFSARLVGDTLRLCAPSLRLCFDTGSIQTTVALEATLDIPLQYQFSIDAYLRGRPASGCVVVRHGMCHAASQLHIRPLQEEAPPLGPYEQHYADQMRALLWDEVHAIVELALRRTLPLGTSPYRPPPPPPPDGDGAEAGSSPSADPVEC
ncbi:MAG: hypothetical protein AAFS07_18860 [Pseudomonadota bacterium]